MRFVPATLLAAVWGPARVPDSHFFVLGDLRNNSADSRQWGFVPRDHVLGRVWYRWWPLRRSGRLLAPPG